MFARSKRQDVHVAAAERSRRKHRNFEFFRRTFQHPEADTVDNDPDESESRGSDGEPRRTTERRPTQERRREFDDDNRQADVGAQEKRTVALADSAQSKAPSSTNVYTTNVYTEVAQERPWYRRNTRLGADQAMREDRTSRPSRSSCLPD